MQQIILIFFQDVLHNDCGVLERIHHFDGSLYIEPSTKTLIFSLAALHNFLFDDQINSFDEFKKVLYQGEFNRRLQAFNGKVTIFCSKGKIDNNLYQLVKISK